MAQRGAMEQIACPVCAQPMPPDPAHLEQHLTGCFTHAFQAREDRRVGWMGDHLRKHHPRDDHMAMDLRGYPYPSPEWPQPARDVAFAVFNAVYSRCAYAVHRKLTRLERLASGRAQRGQFRLALAAKRQRAAHRAAIAATVRRTATTPAAPLRPPPDPLVKMLLAPGAPHPHGDVAAA